MSEGVTPVEPPAFHARLAALAEQVERTLDRLLPAGATAPGEAELQGAMRHAALGGGKRLRAFLAVEAGAVFGVPAERALRAGAALECLHAYSLVHDDLPAMDDDDLRRGKPTVHRAYSEATAILAGDALQALAFEILAEPATHPDGAVRAELCLRLAQAGGAGGMVGGQALDLAAGTAQAPAGTADVARLQALKTGALIEVSAEAGAILGAATARERAAIRAYARALGEAFQIADDLLDVTGDAAETGKRTGKDAAAGKATFIGGLGIDGARARARELVVAATAELARWPGRAGHLAAAAVFAADRRS